MPGDLQSAVHSIFLYRVWLVYDQEALSPVCKLCSVHSELDFTPVRSPRDLLKFLSHTALLSSNS